MTYAQIERLLIALDSIADSLKCLVSLSQTLSLPSPPCSKLAKSHEKEKSGKGSAEGKPKQKQTDEEWEEMLAMTYLYLDVKLERAKCVAWCATHGRQFTRKRFVNWLNRIEKPMQKQSVWD